MNIDYLVGIVTFKLTFPGHEVSSYTTRRAPRVTARQHAAATIPRPFSLPLTRTAIFVLEVLDADAVEATAVSEAWWTRVNMSLTATPTYEVASEGAKVVITVCSGNVPVIVSTAPVIVCPSMVHVPFTIPTSP